MSSWFDVGGQTVGLHFDNLLFFLKSFNTMKNYYSDKIKNEALLLDDVANLKFYVYAVNAMKGELK